MLPRHLIVPLTLLAACLWSAPLLSQTSQVNERPGSRAATSATARLESWALHQKMLTTSPFASLSWECVGPRMSGGRIESVTCDPRDSATIFVGVGSGGLWKSINNGVTWQPIFDDQPTQAIGDVAIAPSDPDTVWVGTGEILLARSALTGIGVFKSTDSGETWQHMGLPDSQHIGKIAIDPTDPQTVYVAAIGHLSTPNQERGVFKTTDGGKTWTHSLFVSDTTAAMDLFISAGNREHLFCSTWHRFADGSTHVGPNSGIHRSLDGGKTWTKCRIQLEGIEVSASSRVAIAQAATQPDTIYALLDEARIGDQPPKDILCRSDDAGETWRLVNDKDLSAGWDWCEIQVDPNDPQVVYSIGQRSFLSTDGGKTFKRLDGTIVHLLEHGATSLHLDTHCMWIDPHDSDHVIFGNDGGVFVTHDRGETWLHLNNLPIAECYAVTYDQADPYRIYIGTQDNAALFGPSTHRPRDGSPDAWQHVYLDPWGGGDSYFTYRDPTDDSVIYYEHQYGELRRKDMTTADTKNIRPKAPEGSPPLRFAWMTPFFPSHHDPHTLYYGADRVFRSPDRGDSWSVISPDLAAGPKTPNLRYQAITTLAESPRTPGRLAAGTDNGNLFKTTDDGEHWQAIDRDLPRCQFTRVRFSSHQDSTLFVTLNGLPTDDFSPYVYRSDDLGDSWQDISAGLPMEAVNVIVEDPAHQDVLYVGTNMGVYVSLNGGDEWHALGQGLPPTSVDDLFLHPATRELVAGTHGRSVWLIDLSSLDLSTTSQP